MNRKITVAKTAGFCFGVNRAVDMVYNAMCERAKLSTYEYIRYIKKEKNQKQGEKTND